MPEPEDHPRYHWKTVRVFISSTARDFHAERDYLVKYVFPELREWCEKWKLHLVDIDLRWGLGPEELAHGRTIEICLEAIDGHRPFFIGLLGNAYGWVPAPDRLPGKRTGAYDWLRGREDDSITHLEIQHAVLDPSSSVDKAERSPHAFFYFRDETCLPAPDALPGFSPADREEYARVFYEQDPGRQVRLESLKAEIRAHYERLGAERNNPGETADRIFGYAPEFDPELANPEDDALKGRFTRDSLREFGERVREDLKKSLAGQFQDRIAFLSGQREEDPLEAELELQEAFVEDSTQFFVGREAFLQKLRDYVTGNSRRILAVYGKPGSGKSALLARFYEELRESARVSESDAGSVQGVHAIPLFVGAGPGSRALPSLLQSVCRNMHRHCGPAAEREARLAQLEAERAGQDPSSPWWAEQRRKIDADYQIPSETGPLRAAFLAFLRKTRRPIVLVIDGLNQLDETDGAQNLEWLPTELPLHVKIVASTLESRAKEALRNKTQEEVEVPRLTDKLRLAVLRARPSMFCKQLAPEHEASLLRKEWTRNPLYLHVALEEIRLYGGTGERLLALIESLPSGIPELFDFVLARLEREFAASRTAEEGPGIVERVFCLLACARYGLTGGELQGLLAQSDPDSTHQLVLRSLRGYLLQRGPVRDFRHRALAKAVHARYLGGDRAQRWHGELAAYFHAQPVYVGAGTDRPDLRKLDEQLWQQVRARDWAALERALTDFRFLEAHVRAGRIRELVAGFQDALAVLPQGHGLRDTLTALYGALRRDADFIALHPDTLFQCLWNSCWWYDSAVAARHYRWLPVPRRAPLPWDGLGSKLSDLLESWRAEKESEEPGFLWLRCCRPPAMPSDCGPVAMFRHGDGRPVMNVVWSADGRLLASRSDQGWAQVWDLVSGRELQRAEGRKGGGDKLFPKAGPVCWPDGEPVRWSDGVRPELLLGGRVCVRHGQLVMVSGDLRWLNGAQWEAKTRDGHRMARCGEDGTILIVDLRNDGQLLRLLGDTAEVWTAAWSPDETRLAAGSANGWVRVFRVQSRLEGCVRRYNAREDWLFSPDGSRIWSRSGPILSARDARTGEVLFEVDGVTDAIAFSPRGDEVCVAFKGGALSILDAHTGEERLSLAAPSERVGCIQYGRDGKHLVAWRPPDTEPRRRAVRTETRAACIWDAATGELLHADVVSARTVLCPSPECEAPAPPVLFEEQAGRTVARCRLTGKRLAVFPLALTTETSPTMPVCFGSSARGGLYVFRLEGDLSAWADREVGAGAISASDGDCVPCNGARVLVCDCQMRMEHPFRLMLPELVPGITVDFTDRAQTAVETFCKGHPAVILVHMHNSLQVRPDELYGELSSICERYRWEPPAMLVYSGSVPSEGLRNMVQESAGKHAFMMVPLSMSDVADFVREHSRRTPEADDDG